MTLAGKVNGAQTLAVNTAGTTTSLVANGTLISTWTSSVCYFTLGRALHSFPTRRSSDLGTTTFGGVVGPNVVSITTDAAGTTAINTTAIGTTGTQTYNDAVT